MTRPRPAIDNRPLPFGKRLRVHAALLAAERRAKADTEALKENARRRMTPPNPSTQEAAVSGCHDERNGGR